jgi:hypothetical protein
MIESHCIVDVTIQLCYAKALGIIERQKFCFCVTTLAFPHRHLILNQLLPRGPLSTALAEQRKASSSPHKFS